MWGTLEIMQPANLPQLLEEWNNHGSCIFSKKKKNQNLVPNFWKRRHYITEESFGTIQGS